jgi:hypothetical protein
MTQYQEVIGHGGVGTRCLEKIAESSGFAECSLREVDMVNVGACGRRGLRNGNGQERKKNEQQGANALHGLLLILNF